MPNLVKVLATLVQEQRRLQGELNNVDAAITALRGVNGGGRNVTSISRPRRRLSTAARKRIAAAQRARWAKFRAQKKAA
jgi:hypothetical protein